MQIVDQRKPSLTVWGQQKPERFLFIVISNAWHWDRIGRKKNSIKVGVHSKESNINSCWTHWPFWSDLIKNVDFLQESKFLALWFENEDCRNNIKMSVIVLSVLISFYASG